MKIFCVGLGKTGTTTFASAMRILGYQHCPVDCPTMLALAEIGGLPALEEVINRYDSFDDFPWPKYYEQLASRYPDAYYVLTTRKNESVWWKSLLMHGWRRGCTDDHYLAYGCFHPEGNEQKLKKKYQSHNEAVRILHADNPKFLEVCWESGDGWDELCSLLQVPKPQICFPHDNARAQKNPREIVDLLCAKRMYGTALRFTETNENDNIVRKSDIAKHIKNSVRYKKLAAGSSYEPESNLLGRLKKNLQRVQYRLKRVN